MTTMKKSVQTAGSWHSIRITQMATRQGDKRETPSRGTLLVAVVLDALPAGGRLCGTSPETKLGRTSAARDQAR
jgi:hypothetical protein